MNDLALLIAKPWLIEERLAAALYRQYAGGNLDLSNLKEATTQRLAALYAGKGLPIGTHASSYKVKHKSGRHVAIMPVVGTLTKRGELCSYGMVDYMNEIAALNANDDITAIVMEMEGPGGTVDGTPEFGMAVKNSKKPIVTFGDCMVASADYWVASQSRYIVGNKNNPTEFGSIGVLCVHEYWGKFIEENIGEIKIIRAPQSTDKALVNPIEQLTPELEAEIKEDLKQLAKEFHGAVKKGRGSRLQESEKEWGTGKMYKNAEALKLGLIDAIGTMADAIDKAVELSAGSSYTTKSNSANNKTTNMNMKKVARKVSSFFTKKAAAKPAAEEPAAAEEAVPMWTEDMIFNTDGSGDGAFCMHADSAGTDRKFETKIDNNQGNEPPTDPAITEDANWALVAEEAAPAEEEGQQENEQQEPAASQVLKLNAALKKERALVASLQAENAQLKAEKKANADKPAAPATTVVATGDNEGPKKFMGMERKRAERLGYKLDAEGNVLSEPKK